MCVNYKHNFKTWTFMFLPIFFEIIGSDYENGIHLEIHDGRNK